MSCAHGCTNPNCPECLHGWTPAPDPEPGSARWKDDMALRWATDMGLFNLQQSLVVELPDVAGWPIGLFALRYTRGVGWDYFRVDALTEVRR